MFWTGTVNLVNFFCVWVIGIQASKLALSITEKEQKVWAITPVYDVQNSVTSVGIHYTRKDHVLDGIENDRSVRLRRRLAVKASS